MLGFVPLYSAKAGLFGVVVPRSTTGDWVATSDGRRTSVHAILPTLQDPVLWPLQRPTSDEEVLWLQFGSEYQDEDQQQCLDPNVGPQTEDVHYIHVDFSGRAITMRQSKDIYPAASDSSNSRTFAVPFIDDADGVRHFGAALDAQTNNRETARVSVNLTGMRSSVVAWERNLRTRVEQVEKVVDQEFGTSVQTPPPVLQLPTLEFFRNKNNLEGLHFVHIRRPMEGNLHAAKFNTWALEGLALLKPQAAVQSPKVTSQQGLRPKSYSPVLHLMETVLPFQSASASIASVEVFEELPFDQPVLKESENGGVSLFYACIGIMDVFGICSTEGGPWFITPLHNDQTLDRSVFFRYLYPRKSPSPVERFPVPSGFPEALYSGKIEDHDAELLLSTIVADAIGAGQYPPDNLVGLRASALALDLSDLQNLSYQTDHLAPIAGLARALEGLNATGQDDMARLDPSTQARLVRLRLQGKLKLASLWKLQLLEEIVQLSDDEIDGLGYVLNSEFLVPGLEVFTPTITGVHGLIEHCTDIERHLSAITNDISEIQRSNQFQTGTVAECLAFLDECIAFSSSLSATSVESDLPEGLALQSPFIRAYVASTIRTKEKISVGLADTIERFNAFLPGVTGSDASKVLEEAMAFEDVLCSDGIPEKALREPDWAVHLCQEKQRAYQNQVSAKLNELRNMQMYSDAEDALRQETERLHKALRILERNERWLFHRHVWRSINDDFMQRQIPELQQDFDEFFLLRSGPPHTWPVVSRKLEEAICSSK